MPKLIAPTHMSKTKTLTAEVVRAGSADGLDEGTVEAIVSVYDVVDHDGDRVKAGAFDDFAAKVNSGAVTLPVVWQHRLDDPDLYLGKTISLDADADAGDGRRGLMATMQFRLDKPKAASAYALIKDGDVNQWSHRWDGRAATADDGAVDLSDMRLAEISPVLVGANELTHTRSVKERGEKSYLNIDVPGSYEAAQDAIRAALNDRYPQGSDFNGPWTNLVATMSDRVCYQVCNPGDADDELFWADYSIAADGSVTLGDPSPAQATLSGAAAADAGQVKAGDRSRLKLEAEQARAALLL